MDSSGGPIFGDINMIWRAQCYACVFKGLAFALAGCGKGTETAPEIRHCVRAIERSGMGAGGRTSQSLTGTGAGPGHG